MAKKVRTPKPPRSGQAPRAVQAPQRRSGPARTSRPGLGGNAKWWLLGLLGVVLVAVGIALPVALSGGSGKTKDALPGRIPWGKLPGLQTGPVPWPANSSTMTGRLSLIGLNPLGAEALAFHIHQHLDLYVDGKKVTVPRFIGIDVNPATNQPIFTEIHTHDSTGLIHVESADQLNYKLGQFFGVWGVKLTPTAVGKYRGRVSMWVNGKRYLGNPAKLVLKSHQEIVLAEGKPPADIPSSYDFPANT